MVTPREILEQVHRRVLAGDFAGVADLVAEDVVIERPFAPAEVPARIEGRDDFRADLTTRMSNVGVELLGFESVEVHQTADPELIIAEFALRGRIRRRDYEFTRRYIQLLRVRDGRIVLWRDYFDPVGLAKLREL